MFDLFNLALLVFINKVRMGILNKPCVPVIWDALWSSPPPGPFLQEGAGAGPAVDTGPAVCGPSPPCGRYRTRWGPGAGREGGSADTADMVLPLCGWRRGERLFPVLFLEEPYSSPWGFPGGSVVKNLPSMQETWVPSMGQEDALEDEMATHSSILAWRIPWTEEPDGLQSVGL